jgi:hypothetical protein
MHELWLVKPTEMTNITPIVGNITWGSNIDELAQQFEFQIAYNDDKYFPKNPCDLGNLVIFKNETSEIFRGIIFEEPKNGRSPIGYTCFDYAIYLNESKKVKPKQFNGVSAKQAITNLITEFGVPIGKIVDIKTKIDKIYYDKTIAEIIKDILTQAEQETGIKYRLEMRAGKFYIEKYTDLIINPTFKLASNINDDYCVNSISNPTRKRSIKEMRNSIIIVSTKTEDKKEYVTIQAQVKNDSLIKQYGLLQEVQTVDQKDISKAKNIAKNLPLIPVIGSSILIILPAITSSLPIIVTLFSSNTLPNSLSKFLAIFLALDMSF